MSVCSMDGELTETSMKELDRVYIADYRWWKDWEDSACQNEARAPNNDFTLYCSKLCEAPSSMLKNSTNINSPDLVFDLLREDSSVESVSHETSTEGRHYVLLTEDVWRQIHTWYSGRTSAKNIIMSGSSSKEYMKGDLYPLRLRMTASAEGNQVTVRISRKDNEGELYRRACELFNIDSEQVHIWDLFGQTKLALISNENNISLDAEKQMVEDILLELQVDGIWQDGNIGISHGNGSVGNELAIVPVETSRSEPSLAGGLTLSNGTFRSSSPDLSVAHPLSSSLRNLDGIGSSGFTAGPLGLTGLHNLGNTCFMNSALQCLVHTPKLVEYFLEDYSKEINRQNPLGMDGELALAFGDLLRKLWAPGRTPIAPRAFKAKLARFAPQFSGYNQHDSQELLAFLLDGLHEDLNRVKHKPYIESKDADGRPDEEVAEEYWENHKARNDSIIVDLCQGQFKSTLVCPICNKISVTFDPFMYLSLPLPSTMTRTMTVTVFSTDGTAPPKPYTVTVPKQGKCKDLVKAVSVACSLRNDEKLLMAEIYNHKIIRLLEDPFDPLSPIRDDQYLAAYRLCQEESPLLEFMHRRKEEDYFSTQSTGYWKPFGTPLITRLQNDVHTGADLQAKFQTLLSPLLRPKNLSSFTQMNIAKENGHKVEAAEDVQMEDLNDQLSISNGTLDDDFESLLNDDEKTIPNGHSGCPLPSELSFQLILTDERGTNKEGFLKADDPVLIPRSCRRLQVLVYWPEKMLDKYDTHLLDTLSEVLKFGFATKRMSQEPISLYACLEAFLNEEPLGPEDMWYCPSCKEHRQASKKLDLWRLPEILVVHLKRFSYSRFIKNKLETFVNFPTHDLDLTNYVAGKNGPCQSNIYELYAVSNHYGSMGGGHYTAYVNLIEENGWYNFDDSHVSPVSEDRIKTSAAYVLFYRRVKPEDQGEAIMEDLKTLKVELDEATGVVHLILNRPSQRNALDTHFFTELPRLLSALDENPSVRIIILKGSGIHFCSGIDLSTLGSIALSQGEDHVDDGGRVREKLRRNIKHTQAALSAVEECRKPVIAAIHGACIGAGVDLITACDIRYCSEDAFFCVKEVDVGITADLGTLQRLPRLVGDGNARELSLTGRRIDALEAKHMGLVQKVYPTKSDMDEKVGKIARDIAAKSPLAVIGTKAVLLNSRDLTVDKGLDYVATWNAAMLLSTDVKEVFAAQVEKRKPMFSKL